MDRRTDLKKNDRLRFPGLECVIDAPAGRGASVLAYTAHYADNTNPSLSHRVLIREYFPYDAQGGIYRRDHGNMDICVEESSRALFEYGRAAFLRDNEVHLRMAASIPSEIDLHINTFSLNNTLYSVLGYSGGRSLLAEIESRQEEPAAWGAPDTPGAAAGSGAVSADFHGSGTVSGAWNSRALRTARIARILRGALEVLGAFHKEGYLHLDVSPDNILLIGEGEKERVTLIDFNSVHTVDEIVHNNIRLTGKEGYTAPEVRMGIRGQIGPWTDLFSMTAVLWHCLAGKKLSPMQLTGAAPADPSALPLLENCPAPVLSQLRRILAKGLSASPGRRYRAVPGMLADLAELESRILGKGITHWALWESGRARFFRMMRENTGLQYIRDDEKIYPLYAEREDGSRIKLEEALFPADRPALLLGGGGTGKTTALCRIACRQPAKYAPEQPAVFYIPLSGYTGGGKCYVQDRLLEGLRFLPHTDSMESARRELLRLLEAHPVLLLLDGLNEASGDTKPLLGEIRMLAEKSGVQILLTSRSDPGEPDFEKYSLCRLEVSDVRAILAGEGVLPPENMEVLDLLCFPLLLSLYVRAVRDGGNQLRLQSREELLRAYFHAILVKEAGGIPGSFPAAEKTAVDADAENTGRPGASAGAEAGVSAAAYTGAGISGSAGSSTGTSMGVEAAVRYLLPEISVRMRAAGHPLSPAELMPVVETCFRELPRRTMTVVYPEWIGHSAELRAGAKNADEWFGTAVLDLLWKRFGLLVRDEQGRFRILHEILEEYLVEQSVRFHERFDREKRRARRWQIAAAAAVLFVLIAGFGAYNYAMRLKITRKHRQMVEAQTSRAAVEYIGQSEKALSRGDRQEAVRAAAAALLLEYAEPEEAEELLLSRDNLLSAAEKSTVSPEDVPAAETARRIPASLDSREGGPYAAQAQKALTDALGVYDFSYGYRTDSLLELPAQPVKLSLSPDGSRICAICAWNLLVYDVSDGKELYSLQTARTALAEAVFLDEDRIVYTAPDSLRAFDAAEGAPLWEIPGPMTKGAAMSAAADSAGGESTGAAAAAGDSVDGDNTADNTGKVPVLAVSADGRRLAAVYGEDAKAYVIDAADGTVLKTISFEKKHLRVPFRAVMGDPKDCLLALNADGTMLAAGFSDGSLSLFDLKNDTRRELSGSTAFTHFSGGFSGRYFACAMDGGGESRFCLWDSKTGACVESFDEAERMPLQADEDGVFLAAGNEIMEIVVEEENPEGDLPADSAASAGREVILETTAPVYAFCRCGGDYLVATRTRRFFFYYSETGIQSEISSVSAFDFDFTGLSEDTAMLGGMNTGTVRLLRRRAGSFGETGGVPETDPLLFSYDPSCPHIEARLSADRKTVMLYHSAGFQICSTNSGETLCEFSLPDAASVYDEQFVREGGSSRLEVTWFDGTVRCYSAADGSLLSVSHVRPPDRSLREAFVTGKYRLVSMPQKPTEIFDLKTGEKRGEFNVDANLAYVTEVNGFLIMEYFTTVERKRYGLLVNDSFEILAELPGLCDILGDELIFDDRAGSLYSRRLYSLQELFP
ncbi:MAG: protein kinase family protein [Eubacteriales bacterium]|nr:protein kinase family protein [Eubacteriales bacterium]